MATQNKSFAAVASKPRLVPRFTPVELSARQYSIVDGKPSVLFTVIEFDAGAALFKHSLVAKFIIGRPSIGEIRQVFKENWPIKGRATVSDIWDSRHLMIIFDSEEDAKVALASPLRKIGHAMFRLFRCTSDYNPKRESTTITKWVRLPGIHPTFITKNYVAGIVNSFGYFLDLDEKSKACSTLRYVRACVEIDVRDQISDEVRISLSDGRFFWQKIEVEGSLSYCSHCKIHGHTLSECRKKKPVKSDSQLKQSSAGNTNKIDESSSLAVTFHNGQETKRSKPSSHNAKEEWVEVEVKRKKGARSVKFHTNNSISHLIQENLQENTDTNIEAVREEIPVINYSDVGTGEMGDKNSINSTIIQEDISNGDLYLVMVHNEMDNEMKMVNNQSISHKQAISQQQEEGAVVNSHVNGDDEVNDTEENMVDKSSARNKAVVTDPFDTIVPSVVPGGIDGSASTEEHKEEMHSSDLQIPEEIAQKFLPMVVFSFIVKTLVVRLTLETFTCILRQEAWMINLFSKSWTVLLMELVRSSRKVRVFLLRKLKEVVMIRKWIMSYVSRVTLLIPP